MSDLSPGLRAVLRLSELERGLPRRDVEKLEAAIVNSPYLAALMNRAVQEGSLTKFAMSSTPNEAAHYDPIGKSIHLSIDTLSDPRLKPQQQSDLLTVALGHETAHALRSKVARDAVSEFASAVSARLQDATGNESYVDLTAPTKKYLNEFRHNEALAELAGLNALASRMRIETDGPPDRAEFIRRASTATSCVTTDNANKELDLAAGVKLNEHGYQNAKDPASVEAIARCYYDQSQTLGRHRDSGYNDYFGVSAMQTIAAKWYDAERDGRLVHQQAPAVHLDMAALKLDPRQIERNGLDLSGRAFGFVDLSHGKMQLATIRHTLTTANQDAPKAEIADHTAAVLRPDHPGHPDHGLLEQIRRGVRAIDEKIGKSFDEASERLSRSLLAACKDNREAHPQAHGISLAANAINRADHVVLGHNGNAFVIEGRLDDPAHKRASLPVQQAAATPVEQSDEKLRVANQSIALEAQRTQSQSQQLDQAQPSSQIGPRIAQ